MLRLNLNHVSKRGYRRQQTIHWTGLGYSIMRYCGVELKTIAREMFEISMFDRNLQLMTNLNPNTRSQRGRAVGFNNLLGSQFGLRALLMKNGLLRPNLKPDPRATTCACVCVFFMYMLSIIFMLYDLRFNSERIYHLCIFHVIPRAYIL